MFVIVLKSGAKVEFDATEVTLGRSNLTGNFQTIEWTTPKEWNTKLLGIAVDEIAAVYRTLEDQEERDE